ncbi:hypothetical protein B0H19DRAFT_1085782 [Mycena capillaripes]|nr:hypothetical protein B0H19DRAFT_1085782 [Mycena capillaripes]
MTDEQLVKKSTSLFATIVITLYSFFGGDIVHENDYGIIDPDKLKLLVTGARRFDRLLGILVESAKMGGLLACSIGFAAALYGPMGIIWGTWVIVATKIEEAKDRPALHFSVGSAYDHCSI